MSRCAGGNTNHVEGISRQRQRVSEESADELEKEERRINANHDLDTGAFGPCQLGGHGEWMIRWQASGRATNHGWRKLSGLGGRGIGR